MNLWYHGQRNNSGLKAWGIASWLLLVRPLFVLPIPPCYGIFVSSGSSHFTLIIWANARCWMNKINENRFSDYKFRLWLWLNYSVSQRNVHNVKFCKLQLQAAEKTFKKLVSFLCLLYFLNNLPVMDVTNTIYYWLGIKVQNSSAFV